MDVHVDNSGECEWLILLSVKYVPTTCPYCGVGCGLNLVVNEGKLVGVEPYKRSPVNEGKLCPKGAMLLGSCPEPDRLDETPDQEG